MFKPLRQLIFALLAFMFFLLTLFLRVQSIPPPVRLIVPKQLERIVLNLRLSTALSFGLALVFLLLLINALLAERQSRKKLMLANAQLRQYALRIEDQATLQERNRIAREMHDSLGHALAAQSIQLENALMFGQSNAEQAQAFMLEAKQLGSKALQDVRQSMAALRCDPLQGQSLESAITFLVKDFHRKTGIMPDCQLSLSFLLSPLNSEVNTAIYWIVKEALNNIYKHGAATQVTIHLQSQAKTLSLMVKDNGRGFNPEQNPTVFELQGMRERAEELGGRFELTSILGAGCRIVAYIPLLKLYP